ncbi:MAG: family 16 glycoside hydrolase [Bacteroidota bacterium]
MDAQNIKSKLVFTVTLVLILNQMVLGQAVPFISENWRIIDNENNQNLDFHTTTYKGENALRLGRHKIARLEGKNYENFVLEVDIAGKAMPGIGFHASDLWDYEFLYCRVFSGGKTDALQYAPVYNGALPWQLYNAPNYETMAVFEPKEWFHLKIEVYGNLMRVFVGEDDEPEMEVALLQKEAEKGAIFLKTSFAEAYFANLRINRLDVPFSVRNEEKSQQFLTNWEISEQLQGNLYSQRQFYQWFNQAKEAHTWKVIKAAKNGIVNLAQYFDHPKESVFARTNIPASEAKKVTLAFDYTQVLLIVFNDQVLFFGRELDSDNFMRMMDGEQKIDLSLKKGDNTLVFWIRSDDEWQDANPRYLGRKQAMNWGFIAKVEE